MSASNKVKALWLEEIEKSDNKHVSLKSFARKLKDDVAKEWLDNKNGKLDKKAKEQRLKNKSTMLSEMRTAKKTKTQKGSGSKSNTVKPSK